MYNRIMRRSFDKKFKAKIALEAIRETKTIQELARQYKVHPNQISLWKKQLLEGAEDIFERPNKKREEDLEMEKKQDDLLRTVGELTVENKFLKKTHRQLYGREFP
jgi:transposase-like protein